MTEKWEAKEPKDPDLGPYVHWWDSKEREFLPPDIQEKMLSSLIGFRGAEPGSVEGNALAAAFYKNGETLPLSSDVANPIPMEKRPGWESHLIADRLPDNVPEDTVITGILDTGIALSHMTTNIAAGETRVISSWQQGAEMEWVRSDEGGDADQPKVPADDWLPCGREVFSGDINRALIKHGNSQGIVDEIAFNRDLKLSAPEKLTGNRDLEMAAAHGTHTLSLAAGIDPADMGVEELRRQRIIAVNLPAQYHHGSAGNFLAYFAVYGVDRILHVADALWEKNTKEPQNASIVRGYPIVINFSYGMTGGSKDGYHMFERALALVIDRRKKLAETRGQTASPVRIMMPVGNENLAQGAASIVLGAKGTTLGKYESIKALQHINLPWRIKPADKTANFLEVWSEEKPEHVFKELLKNAQFFVTPPGRERLKLATLENGEYQDLADYGRVYCQFFRIDRRGDAQVMKAQDDSEVSCRLALLICVAPTADRELDAPCAPAGAWIVEVAYDGREPVDFTFYIQTDQSAVVTSETGLRSYFDHPNYRTHLIEHPNGSDSESGELADTFSFDEVEAPTDNDDWYRFGPVQRRGSHNALSSLSRPEMIAVGSFDDATGYPTHYSATTDGNPQLDYDEVVGRERNRGREVLTVCYPGENAPSLFGLIGAGARDGSVTSARGTSMSTALATREAALAFLGADPSAWEGIGTQMWFRDKAALVEAADKTDIWGQELKWPIPGEKGRLKMGWGRLPDPRSERVARLGQEDWEWADPRTAAVPAE